MTNCLKCAFRGRFRNCGAAGRHSQGAAGFGLPESGKSAGVRALHGDVFSAGSRAAVGRIERSVLHRDVAAGSGGVQIFVWRKIKKVPDTRASQVYKIVWRGTRGCVPPPESKTSQKERLVSYEGCK